MGTPPSLFRRPRTRRPSTVDRKRRALLIVCAQRHQRRHRQHESAIGCVDQPFRVALEPRQPQAQRRRRERRAIGRVKHRATLRASSAMRAMRRVGALERRLRATTRFRGRPRVVPGGVRGRRRSAPRAISAVAEAKVRLMRARRGGGVTAAAWWGARAAARRVARHAGCECRVMPRHEANLSPAKVLNVAALSAHMRAWTGN